MLDDADSWPVTCAACGNVFPREIGTLKQATSLTCPRCRTDLTFHRSIFVSALKSAKVQVDPVARTTVLTEKKT
ncbi:MAG TPA: hypothetical protein VK741_31990 [Acetobacteraceae bacterium]|jgi:uncharacterized paraquat-inducible protein A|nr:hypothetical protein [Acetobacteraceae bacterium]